MRLYKEQPVNWYKWAVISRSFGSPRECDEGKDGAERRVALKRGEEDDAVLGMESVQPRARCWIRATDQSRWHRSDFPNVPPVSDTSNLARSTIQRVILVNANLSATGILRWIYLQSSFSQAGFDTPFFCTRHPLRFRRRIFTLVNAKPRIWSRRIPSEVKWMKDGRITPTFHEVMAQRFDKDGRHGARERVRWGIVSRDEPAAKK